jgi:hypothetical protein
LLLLTRIDPVDADVHLSWLCIPVNIVPLGTQINAKLKLQTPETVTAAPLLEV